jgi:hypothetical protein
MAPIALGSACYPVIGTCSSDRRRTGHGRLPDSLAMSPDPWRQRHCRSSRGDFEKNAQKHSSRYGSSGDAHGDIEPDRASRRLHRSAPAVATAAPPLRELRMGGLPRQGLRPVFWLAFSCSSPNSFKVFVAANANSIDSTVSNAPRSTLLFFSEDGFRAGPCLVTTMINASTSSAPRFSGITSPLWAKRSYESNQHQEA